MSGNIQKKKWGTGEANVEGRTITELTEAEIDGFIDGIGLVTESIYTDNIITGVSKWFLFASSKMISLNHYEVSQTRYYEKTWQKRTGNYFQDVMTGSDWTYEWNAWGELEAANEEYSCHFRDSVDYFSQLPSSGNLIGDIRTVKNPYQVVKRVLPIAVNDTDDTYVSDSGFLILYVDSGVLPPESDGSQVVLYGLNVVRMSTGIVTGDTAIFVYNTELTAGNYYIELSSEFEEYHTTEVFWYEQGANSKVIWTGSSWESFTGDLSDYAKKGKTLKDYGIEDGVTKEELNSKISILYKPKGSKENYTDLPTNGNEIGDVWNVKNAYKKSLSAMPVTVTEVDTGYITDGGFLILYIYDISTEIYDGSSTLTGNLYTEDGEFLSWAEVLANGVLKVSTDLADMETGSYYLELTAEDKTQYNTATITKEYCKAGENVVWTEEGWDNLGGIYDLSVYATKEELGNVEETLSTIIAMQESLINGG